MKKFSSFIASTGKPKLFDPEKDPAKNDKTKAVHFIGFRTTDQFWRAKQIFGPPDFIHLRYDQRAVAEIVPGDIVVFAKGDDNQVPSKYSHDDSSFF